MSSENRNILGKYENKTDDEIRDQVFLESFPYCVMALNIHGCLNIGNMMRTANLCGCRKFIIFGRRYYDKRSCVGTQNYITHERIMGIAEEHTHTRNLTTILQPDDYILDENVFFNYIVDNDYLPIFVEQDITSVRATTENIISIVLEAKQINRMPIFIFGNEHEGIPRNILHTRSRFANHFTIELGQMGAICSHNVGCCCAILCYKIMEVFQAHNNILL
jgi:tRNA G18 (ribose-2'-O)-methylase SpoU